MVGRRKMHIEEFHNLYSYQILFGEQIKDDQMGGACNTNVSDEKCI
jgi:hypothetical protein